MMRLREEVHGLHRLDPIPRLDAGAQNRAPAWPGRRTRRRNAELPAPEGGRPRRGRPRGRIEQGSAKAPRPLAVLSGESAKERQRLPGKEAEAWARRITPGLLRVEPRELERGALHFHRTDGAGAGRKRGPVKLPAPQNSSRTSSPSGRSRSSAVPDQEGVGSTVRLQEHVGTRALTAARQSRGSASGRGLGRRGGGRSAFGGEHQSRQGWDLAKKRLGPAPDARAERGHLQVRGPAPGLPRPFQGHLARLEPDLPQRRSEALAQRIQVSSSRRWHVRRATGSCDRRRRRPAGRRRGRGGASPSPGSATAPARRRWVAKDSCPARACRPSGGSRRRRAPSRRAAPHRSRGATRSRHSAASRAGPKWGQGASTRVEPAVIASTSAACAGPRPAGAFTTTRSPGAKKARSSAPIEVAEPLARRCERGDVERQAHG